MYLTPDEFRLLERLVHAPGPLNVDLALSTEAESLQELGLARRSHQTWRATAYGISRWRSQDGLQH